MPPDSFWLQTPRRLKIIFAARAVARERAHNERAWLAWHAAAIPHMSPMPQLRDLLIGFEAPEPVLQSMDQQIAAAMAWTSAIAGRA